jgi:hypothetical protein
MNQASVPRAATGRTIVLAVVLLAAAAAAGADEPGFVLDLPDGGRLPGRFTEAAESDGPLLTLGWRAAEFETPLEFWLDEVVGIRATGEGEAAAEPRGFSCRLRGGDSLDGDLREIDATHVVIVAPGGEAVRIDRGIVTSVARRKAVGAAGYVGPGGLAGWTQSPEAAWRDEAGRIIGEVPNASLARDVAGPPRARYDIVLSWRERPELSLAIAAGGGKQPEPYRLELLSTGPAGHVAMLVRQEPQAGMLEPLDLPVEAPGRLQLTLFVDQAVGRLAVAFAGGEEAVELTVPPQDGRGPSGRFLLQLLSGDVCLERLRVSAWQTADPLMSDPDLTRVTLRSGETLVGEVAAVDADGGLVVKGASGEQRRELADLEEIAFAAAEEPAAEEPAAEEPEQAAVRVVRRSGGVLTGQLVAVGEDSLAVGRTGIDRPVAVPLTDLQSLVSLRSAEPRPLPGRAATIRVADAELAGCLIDAVAWGGGIAWQPRGSLEGSRLAGSEAATAARVDYVPRAEPADDARAVEVEVGGMGGAVNLDDEGFFVVTMLAEEGAAARDGRIQPGDRILAIRPTADAPFVETTGLELTTVMNLLRGRVGTPVSVRVGRPEGRPRRIDLVRGLIYVADRQVLDEALAAHARVAAGQVAAAAEAAGFPSLLVLRSGDVVPAEIEAIDAAGVRMRSPATAADGAEPVVVPQQLVRAVELDPDAASRGIERIQWERLLTLPRSQQANPPTHLVRLAGGDYLRGRLEAVDAAGVRFNVLGQSKRLPREAVVRIIWLHADEIEGLDAAAAGDDRGGDEPAAAPSEAGEGLLVQGITADGGRTTLVAERMEGPVILGTSQALGPSRIDTRRIDRLLVGKAIPTGDEKLPFAKWRLKLAPLPRALRDEE